MRAPTASRRALLRGLGASALALPFVPILNASGETAGGPRLVLLFSANGTVYSHWKPEGTGSDFTCPPGSILESFEDVLPSGRKVKEMVLVLDGIRMRLGGPADPHQQGFVSMWTGCAVRPGNFTGGSGQQAGWAGGPSVDQVIAASLDPTIPYKSLEFGVQSDAGWGHRVESRMCYAGADQPITPESDPYAMFERLFASIGNPADPEALRRIAQKQSVIDSVMGDLTGLAGKVAAADKQKIDAHLQAVRELEKRLDAEVSGLCEVPTLRGGIDVNANDNFAVVAGLQRQLLVAALQCGLTRVASLQWATAVSQHIFSWLPGFGDTLADRHHEMSHNGDARLVDVNRWYGDEFTELLKALDAVPEGDGTMLDNTIVVWGNELATGYHTTHRVPFVIGGGAAGYLNPGRYLDYGDVSNTRLLVSILHAMGLTDMQTFGNLDDGSGPLPDLT